MKIAAQGQGAPAMRLDLFEEILWGDVEIGARKTNRRFARIYWGA